MCLMLGGVGPCRSIGRFYTSTMPWDRADNLWISKQRRLCWLMTAAHIVIGLLVVAAAIVAWRAWSHMPANLPRSMSSMRWLMLAPLLMPAFFLVFMTVHVLREWRVYRLVPEHDAAVCPRCRRIMIRDDDDTLKCPTGHAQWPRSELTAYWEQYGLARTASWRTLGEKRRRFEHRRWDLAGRQREWVQQHPALALLFIPPLITAVGVGVWMLIARAVPLQAIESALHMYVLALGAMCLALGMKQRRGDEPRCAKCEYERLRCQETADAVCPECGAAWNRPGGTVRGSVASRPGFMAAGIGLMLVSVVVLRPSRIGGVSGWLAGAMPTGVLIESLGRSPQAGTEQWAELAQRTLSDDEHHRLAELLLDQRLRTSYFSATAGSPWLEAEVSNATLRPELVDRFYRESLELAFSGPKRAGAGEDVHLTIEGDFRLGTPSLFMAEVAVAGFQADEAPEFFREATGWRAGLSFDSDLRDISARTLAAGKQTPIEWEAPRATLSWNEPGRHTIHFTAWLVIRPGAAASNTRTEIAWNAEGAPVTPPDALAVILIRLSHVIEITR